MDALTEAVIYTVLMVLGGFCAGHWLTLARYERRYRIGIAYQLRREERMAEMDRLEAAGATEAESLDALDALARRSGAV
jgi:hypothetical protein